MPFISFVVQLETAVVGIPPMLAMIVFSMISPLVRSRAVDPKYVRYYEHYTSLYGVISHYGMVLLCIEEKSMRNTQFFLHGIKLWPTHISGRIGMATGKLSL